MREITKEDVNVRAFVEKYKRLYRCTTWQAVKAFYSLDGEFKKFIQDV